MRNTLALVASLFAMALVAVAMFNTNPAVAGLMPQFLMSEQACLDRGEPPEFCAHLATPAETVIKEPTVWVPGPRIPVWQEVPLSQVPAPEVPTGPEAGDMRVWEFNSPACVLYGNFTGHEIRDLLAQDATILRSLSATLALAQADMAWSLTEASQTRWLYGEYEVSLSELTTMSTELAGDIARLDRLVLSFPDSDEVLSGRQARRAMDLCEEQGDLINGYSSLWIDVATVAASITRARIDAGATVAPWRANPYMDMDRLAVRTQMLGLNKPTPECLDALDRQLRDMGIGDCVDK